MKLRLRLEKTEPLTIHLREPQMEVLRIAAQAKGLPMEYVAGEVVKRWLEKRVNLSVRRAEKQVAK